MMITNSYKYKRKLFQFIIKRNCTRSTEKLKILFFGSDNFSLPSLRILHENKKDQNSNIEILEAVTSFKNPINPVRKYSVENVIQLHKWPCEENLNISKFNMGIVVSFGYLIPSSIISKFSMGMINLHASLLPRWRGAAPIVHAIANGDTITGVTIMKIEPKHFDIGDILYQEEVPIGRHILMPELRDTLSLNGSKLVLKTVQNSPECLKQFQKQNDLLASYAPKVKYLMAEINWINMNANNIYNLYRALYGYKHLVTKYKNFNLKIIEMCYDENVKIETIKPCGFVKFSKNDNTLCVLCKDQTFIRIKKLKVEGKPMMTASDFNNGFLKKYTVDEHFFE